MAQHEDLIFDQGTDVVVTINVFNPDGSAKNISNYSVDAKMKRSYMSDSDDTITFNSIITSGEGGNISLSLTNEQTDSLRHKKYLYDVELSFVDSDSNIIIDRILQGNIIISPSVTK